MEEKIKRLEKEIAEKLDDEQWENYQEVLKYMRQLQIENKDLKADLKFVLNQTLGAFQHNWCIDWNFTEIREKYGLEESEE